MAAIFAATFLAGCAAGTDGEAVTTTATAKSFTSSGRTTTTTTTATTTSSAAQPGPISTEPQPVAMAPGDPRLIPMAAFSDTVGVFMDTTAASPTGRYYWVCNGGNANGAEHGSPVEPGNCSGPLTYEESQSMGAKLYEAVMGGIESDLIDLQQEIADTYGTGSDDGLDNEGDITARFWECIEDGGNEDTCLEM